MNGLLLDLLGIHKATELVRCLGGKRLPRNPVAIRREQRRRLRNRRILNALNCECGDPIHHSYDAVARRFRVSPATAFRIGNPRQ